MFLASRFCLTAAASVCKVLSHAPLEAGGALADSVNWRQLAKTTSAPELVPMKEADLETSGFRFLNRGPDILEIQNQVFLDQIPTLASSFSV